MAKFVFTALACAAGANMRGLQAVQDSSKDDSKPAPASAEKQVSTKGGKYTLPVTAQLSPAQAAQAAKGAVMACGTPSSFNINGVMPQNKHNTECISMHKCKSGQKMYSLKFVAGKDAQEYNQGQEVVCTGKPGVSGKDSIKADAAKAAASTPAARLLAADPAPAAAPAGAVADFKVTNMLPAEATKTMQNKLGCVKGGKLDMTTVQDMPKKCMDFKVVPECKYLSVSFVQTAGEPVGVGHAIGKPLTGDVTAEKCAKGGAAPAAETAAPASKDTAAPVAKTESK